MRPVQSASFLVGTWHNTKEWTEDIRELELAEEDGTLSITVRGANDGCWGTTSAEACVSGRDSKEVGGFYAKYVRESEDTFLAANVKYGILVIQAYHYLKNGQPSYFTREFFSKKDTEPMTVAAKISNEHPFLMDSDRMLDSQPPGPIDLSFYVGNWKNTYHSTGTIYQFRIRAEHDKYYFHGAGVGSPRDWGEIPIIPVAKACNSRAGAGFHGRYDFGFMEMVLSGNANQGIIIIASYNIFKDATGRSSYFRREFFFREALTS
jgi:hypothetical protein